MKMTPKPSITATASRNGTRPWTLSCLKLSCGNAYEADWLLARGYRHLTLTDIAPALCDKLAEKYKQVSDIQVICGDFFALNGAYDLVLEQTFFCALQPELRKNYINKMADLLVPGGLLAGVWFSVEFPFEGPPFGGNPDTYISLLESHFTIRQAGPCLHSAAPRAGNEWFIEALRK
jgi:methyl halide transferase